MFFDNILIDELKEKLRFLAVTVLHAPLGQAGYPLARVLICFHIPIDELAKKLWLLAITILHPSLGQAGYPLARTLIFFTFPSMNE